ncbi:hypothetical protein D3C81_926440 [compost metagenome]
MTACGPMAMHAPSLFPGQERPPDDRAQSQAYVPRHIRGSDRSVHPSSASG